MYTKINYIPFINSKNQWIIVIKLFILNCNKIVNIKKKSNCLIGIELMIEMLCSISWTEIHNYHLVI